MPEPAIIPDWDPLARDEILYLIRRIRLSLASSADPRASLQSAASILADLPRLIGHVEWLLARTLPAQPEPR